MLEYADIFLKKHMSIENKTIIINSPRISYYIGGGEKIALIQAENLANIGANVKVLTRRVIDANQSFLYMDYKNRGISNLTFHEFELDEPVFLSSMDPEVDPNFWNVESLAFASATASLINKIEPDVILSYFLLDGIFRSSKALNLLYLLGNPSVNLQLGYSMMKMYDADISISSIVMKHWSRYADSKNKRYILPTGSELPNDYESQNTSEKYIFFAGRLIERKGVATLIESIAKVRQFNPTIKLKIAGDGPEKDFLENLVKKLSLENNVDFLGFVNSDQINELYRNADLCVFPSHEGEGLLGVVLESMSFGKPVIATKENGNEDVIEHLENGILVSPKDIDELSYYIQLLINNKEIKLNLGFKARKYIEENLTWSKHVARLLSIVNSLSGEQ